MAKILLDYVFPISTIASVPAPSTAFLKQACVVVKPKTGQEGNVGQVFECTAMAQVLTRTDNTNAQQLFNAGMNRVFVLLANDLAIAAFLEEHHAKFWTVLISDDFDDLDLDNVTIPPVAASLKIQDITYTAKTAGAAGNLITVEYADAAADGEAHVEVVSTAIAVAIEAGVTSAQTIADAIAEHEVASTMVSVVVDEGDEADPQLVFAAEHLAGGADQQVVSGELDVGAFDGVVGFSSTSAEVCQLFGAAENRSAFFRNEENGARNMFFAFGKLLSNMANWTNQQYITMPANDEVDDLGEANALFDARVSFVIHDTEYGNRLALFAAGGKAIVAPYIAKNLRIDLQGRALQWIAANQPDYTLPNAAMLEQRLQVDIIDTRYIDTGWIQAGTIDVRLLQDNFVASGFINIAEPRALWRIFGEMRSTL